MRVLVDQVFGNYCTRLRVLILPYPLRELVLEISGGSVDSDIAITISEKIAHATNFAITDPDPWNNFYE